jgi:hypothetical protein
MLLLGTALLASAVAAQSAGADENKLKAAFVYRFATLTTWPESAFPSDAGSACIAVVGEDVLVEALRDVVDGKRIQGHPIEVKAAPSPRQARECQVAFFGASVGADLAEGSRSAGLLTIGDGSSFLSQGGMIRLVRDGRKFRFEINRDAASRAGLQISSKLLRLASKVIEG